MAERKNIEMSHCFFIRMIQKKCARSIIVVNNQTPGRHLHQFNVFIVFRYQAKVHTWVVEPQKREGGFECDKKNGSRITQKQGSIVRVSQLTKKLSDI